MLVIAQTRLSTLPQESWQILRMLGLIVLLAVAAIIVGIIVRRVLKKQIERQDDHEPFTLLELRRLHRNGQITDVEFERTKAAVIARQLSAMDREEGKDRRGAASSGQLAAADNGSPSDSDNDRHTPENEN